LSTTGMSASTLSPRTDDPTSRRRELPRDQTIVTVCRSGHRGGLAARGLLHAGYRVENLDGGMKAWARARLPLDPPGGRVL
jgi:rhodanese-related sulfurtransferase